MRDGTDNTCRPDWRTIAPDRDDAVGYAKALQSLPGINAPGAKLTAARRYDIAQGKFFREQQVSIGWFEIAALDDDAISDRLANGCHQADWRTVVQDFRLTGQDHSFAGPNCCSIDAVLRCNRTSMDRATLAIAKRNGGPERRI